MSLQKSDITVTIEKMPSLQPTPPFRTGIDAFVQEFNGIRAGSISAIHRGRVASRRLRELLPILVLERTVKQDLTRGLRDVTKQLGTVREIDVAFLLTQELTKSRQYSAPALERLGRAVSQERASTRDRLSKKLPAARLEQLARKLERSYEALESRDATSTRQNRNRRRRAWLAITGVRLARRAAAVREAVETAGTIYVPERLHAVRIAVKKLRYAAELAAEAARKGIASDIAALKAVQDVLGRLHDVEVLLVHLRREQASVSPPDLGAWRDLDGLAQTLQDDCRRLHARYMCDRVQLVAIAGRMGGARHEAQLLARRAG
jgi:CHAD domain-containing protein